MNNSISATNSKFKKNRKWYKLGGLAKYNWSV